jgi:lipid A disaccharide synthetase
MPGVVLAVPDLGVVAGREVAKEFVQGDLVPARVAETLGALLDEQSPVRAAQLVALGDVRAKLGTPGAADRVAMMAAELAR